MELEYFGFQIADLEIIKPDLGSLLSVLCRLPSALYLLPSNPRLAGSPRPRACPPSASPSGEAGGSSRCA